MNSSYSNSIILPNNVVEWLTFLIRIREVPGLYLGSGDRLSRDFPQSLQANARIVDYLKT
jgi:hypothetical protein